MERDCVDDEEGDDHDENDDVNKIIHEGLHFRLCKKKNPFFSSSRLSRRGSLLSEEVRAEKI